MQIQEKIISDGLMADPERFAREVLEPIQGVVGERGIITNPITMQPYMVAWRDNWTGRAPAVVLPHDTAQVAKVMEICAATRTPVSTAGR
jgi:FAD/FMN-containing dehydrogenase